MSRRQLTAALGAAVGVGLAGCGAGTNNTTNATDGTVGTVEEGTDEETPAEETEAEETETAEPPEEVDDPAGAVEEGMAVVRIAHLSPDAPNVDVSVAGSEILADVAYGSVSGYYALEPGTYPVSVTAAGEEEAVFEQEVEFDNGAFTVAAFGEVSGQNQEFSVTPLEDRIEAPGDDTAAVRVVHASPDAPPVSVGVADGDTLVERVAFGEASDYAEVPAGSYSLEVAAAEGAGAETETGTEDGTETGTENGTETETETATGTPADTVTESAETETESAATGTATDDGPVATVDVSLTGGTVSSAFATGYLTPDGEAADAPFEVLLTVDAGAVETEPGTPEGTENGTETGTETGTEVGTETGTETGAGTDTEAGTETGTEDPA
ncbi:DUF4397 domain-containing protein [Halobaculum magnesiiphilum]|uniref:DUF4397 domain-containing protein n=1 Tax=Halobaculum magnesiiphilum TaxID=1017351 RepID=A0A8T8WG79_9EURY|nr:DUF4397 domain-containing protein [Halobaculum magnesiiphilum]QZP38872.1 DUF4397 domain-containing protein [Halobaculum magnesiiphilum]